MANVSRDRPMPADMHYRIERVLELEGAWFEKPSNTVIGVQAHIATGQDQIQYAILSRLAEMSMGRAYLGYIDPQTREFKLYDPERCDVVTYKRAGNGVVCEIIMSAEHLNKVQTLDEILSIPGITIGRELVPQ